MKKTLFIALGVLIVAGGAAYFVINNENSAVADNTANDSSDVVAVVNGENITRSDFMERVNQAKQALKDQGLGDQLDNPQAEAQLEDQVFEQMINTELVLQAVADQGLTVSDEDVQAQYDQVVANLGSAEALSSELAKANITDAAFRDNIRDQLLTQQYVTEQVHPDQITVTDEEAKAFYDQSVEGQENVPEYSEVEGQIKSQISQQKANQLIGQLIDQLRANADIQDLRDASVEQ